MMKRLTVRLITDRAWVGVEQTEAIVNKQFFGAFGRFALERVVRSSEDTALVQLTSDQDKGAVLKIFKDLEAKLKCTVDAVGWGWLVAESQEEEPLDIKQRDPYAGMTPQETETGIYPVFTMQAGLLVTFAALLIACISINMPLYCIGPLILALVLLLAHQVRHIQCDEDGIEVRYWLRPARRSSWDQICGLRIRAFVTAPYCRVQFCKGMKSLPITFVIPGLPSESSKPTEMDILVDTIINRASLLYVQGHPNAPFADLAYRRFDADGRIR
jgi:hypothetical protein